MSDDDMEQKVKALLGASQEDSDTTHDIALDALHEKDFITFFQLMSEEQVSRDDVLGMCGLWSDFRSATDVIKCKESVHALYDGYESDYVEVLNKMCGR